MKRALFVLLLAAATSLSAANGLRIVSAGPAGETATLAEANEVRVVFSEPMVVVGRIAQPVSAPFFRIEPAVRGTFRWSGTTTLIFTPDKPLPYATQFTVTVDRSAKAVGGATLDRDYQWTFTTPTVRLVQTQWYRKANGALVIALDFNQPVDADAILQHLQLRTEGHSVELPALPPSASAKRAAILAAAASDGRPVLSFLATEWNVERFPRSRKRIVLETKPGIAPDTWIRVSIGEGLAQQSGQEPTRDEQRFTIQLEPTLLVHSVDCVSKCDPEMRNSINFRTGSGVRFDEMRKATTLTDVTDPANPIVLEPKDVSQQHDYPSWGYALDELGYTTEPAHRYALKIASSLKSDDGQTLGYEFKATIEYWRKSAFISFGAGHGVWEHGGGTILPFHARNFRSVKQWLEPLTIETLMPAMLELRTKHFHMAPDGTPRERKLELPLDQIASIGIDLAPAIGSDARGLAWVAVQPGEAVARALVYDPRPVSTLVQATNLGISVKDSPLNTLILVTRLDNAQPVEGANVSIRTRDNSVFWRGVTDADGLAIAPATDLRRKKEKGEEWEESWYPLGELHFAVIAEKDGDVAYVGSDWNDGVRPWDFDVDYDVSEADPQLRGRVFADRGVYKLGEEVHFKLIARADTPQGMKLLPEGTNVEIVLRDAHANEVDRRSVSVNAWSSAEWTYAIPAQAPLGTWSVLVTAPKQRGTLRGEILIAAYRRPDFRVDATLEGETTIAGTPLHGEITGRYLFGAPMAGQAVKWVYSRLERTDVPAVVRDRWPQERYSFLGRKWDDPPPSTETIQQGEAKLGPNGELQLDLDTSIGAAAPFDYRIEGVVTDVTRQEIAGRASYRVDPAPWYIGLKRPPYFADASKGITTEVVAAGLDGLAVPGVKVAVEVKRLQWTSVRQAEGDGFYGWQSELKEIDAGEWTVETRAEPVTLEIPLPEGGQYLLRARAEDGGGRSTTTRVHFYAVGDGYTAWQRHDHNRIDLVPEKSTYRPGETAQILIKSPWETATALLTTEREGVRTWKQFELSSTQETIRVPITEADIPNVFVSVLLVKGRTSQEPGRDGSDPGKPAFRLGYVELQVEDASKRLQVDVRANRDEFRPASKATIEVDVKDAAGNATQSEVTLWAVDYGVLSLTGYDTPDVLESIYLDKALQVMNEDSRQRIVSRRVLTPKGATDGGGGGRDLSAGTLRKDFRVLAFWVGSLVTNANGRAKTEVTLPESLTTYRIMAVAGDRQSRFGWDDAEIRINKPLMLTPSWPRFLAVGDKAFFGGVVHNQLKRGGRATVSIESLDPAVLTVGGKSTIDVRPGSANEVRFDATAHSVGEARVRMRVQMGREMDAFEDIIPVRVLASPETVAAYGVAAPEATETLTVPRGVLPGYGGLQVELASTALVGLSESARYLVEYPYGCAEQRASRSLALMLAADLGEAFALPGIDPAEGKAAVRSSLIELTRFQCGDGGFSFWPGDCSSASPYLTSWIVHVFHRARDLGYSVNADVLNRAYDYLSARLAEPPPVNEEWLSSYNAWQAFSIKALTEGGRNADSHLTRVYAHRERMPVFALAFLLDALQAKGETEGARVDDLRRRIANSILPEGGEAFVSEHNDPYLLWLWSSNERSTAIVLSTLVRGGEEEELARGMVRWLLQAREDGRWNNTQENAWALQSLVDYYRRYESEVPDFVGSVRVGDEQLARETLRGRSAEAEITEWSMRQLLDAAPEGTTLPVVFTRDGVGTLHYMLRMRYAANVMHHEPLDSGFHLERRYEVEGSTKAATSFAAGDLIEVTLRIRNTKERRYVAVTDPIPAGTEPVETQFATTETALVEQQRDSRARSASWAWWVRSGFDHVERHDDRVNVFATRLGEGEHVFKYLLRATTAGTFVTAPAHVEEMYEPEVFGRTATSIVEVTK